MFASGKGLDIRMEKTREYIVGLTNVCQKIQSVKENTKRVQNTQKYRK